MPRLALPRLLPLLLIALLAPAAHGQTLKLRGRFEDGTTRSAVAGVAVRLVNLADTADVRRMTGRDDGSFEFTALAPHSYRLETTRLGYAPLRQIVRLTADRDLGALVLTPRSVEIRGIDVEEDPAPATQKGDTTEFRAGAVKTHRDATAEDLVQKLPGVTMENGQVKAQGEQVQQVLVNGRPFFGSDPTAAMRNLPAEEIDRIQVYDRMSDQSEFSGFDDGTAQKTMNFILRGQKSQFGRVYGGYGDRDRYQSGGNATFIRGAQRFTLLGLSNNVNQKNFQHQDLIGAMSGAGGGGGQRMMMFGGPRGGGGGGGGQQFRFGGGGGGAFDPGSFLVGGQQGISTTHSGGLNWVDQWGPKWSASGSVFLNDTDTENRQSLLREYLPPQDSLAFYDQRSTSDSRNGNQRVDARIEWTPDSLNSVILAPRLYFQHNRTANLSDAANTTLGGDPLSAGISDTRDVVDAHNLSSRLTLRHRFAKRGRNVSADVNVGHSLRDGEGTQYSLTEYFESGATTRDTLDQESTSRTLTRTLSSRIAFTEPLGRGFQLQAIYNPAQTRSESDARALRLDPVSGGYTVPDSALSNSYESRHVTHTGGLALLYTRGPWKLLQNASYQRTDLESERTFPEQAVIERSYDQFLPSVTLTGSFANRRNLRLAYSTATNAPSINQLQDVVNNANPLSLSTGNPGLRPNYSHTLSLRFSEADPARSRSRFAFLNVTRTSHPIANATFTAISDTVIHGVTMAPGTQLTRPENLDASWNANLFGVYSRPTPWLKSIVSFNGGTTFTRTPTLLNGVENVRNTWALRSGTTLSSNISERLDFTVSYQGSYNLSRSDLAATDRGDYYAHTIGVRFNAVIGPGIVLRQELSHVLQSGVPSAYGQDQLLWNSTLGKRLLKDGRGELRITTTDVLQQDKAVGRNITDSYVQDSSDRTLGRYVQAVFTWSFGGRGPQATPPHGAPMIIGR